MLTFRLYTNGMDFSDPVTLSVTRRVRSDHISEFEMWIHGISQAARTFEGYLGNGVIPPTHGGPLEYTLVIRFDQYQHFSLWHESEVRKFWLERVTPLLEGEPVVNVTPGLEFWFTPPKSQMLRQPPRRKMVLLTLLGLYPISLLLNLEVLPLLGGFPLWLRVLLTSSVIVTTMTYLVMPNITRGFTGWLARAPGKKVDVAVSSGD